jgi:hypothetical protein
MIAVSVFEDSMFLHGLRRSSRFALTRWAKPTLQLRMRSGIGEGLLGFIAGAAGGFRGEELVFREKMNFSIISRGVFFEKFGCVFFLQVGSGRFLESYAVFLGTFCRFGLEAGLKTGVRRLGFHKGQGRLIFVGRFFVLHVWIRVRDQGIGSFAEVKLGKLSEGRESLRFRDMDVYIP